jgi:hypothetical protein
MATRPALSTQRVQLAAVLPVYESLSSVETDGDVREGPT